MANSKTSVGIAKVLWSIVGAIIDIETGEILQAQMAGE